MAGAPDGLRRLELMSPPTWTLASIVERDRVSDWGIPRLESLEVEKMYPLALDG